MRSRTLAAVVALVLAAAGIAHAQTPPDGFISLRQRYFGHENVDAATGAVRSDRVILSWFGVTNFAAAIGGHVVLLDAWVPRGEYSGYVPSSPSELADLRPEAVFLGHGHFDHGADAAEIVARTGATLVGTAEHCAQVQQQAGIGLTVDCEIVGGAPGTVTSVGRLAGVGITAVGHVHSAAESPDASDPHTPAAPPPDFKAVAEHLPSPQDMAHLGSHLGDAEGGTVLYRFEVGDFALTWHDSAGPMKERANDVFDVLRGLPSTDVQVGAIMGFNQITNGMRDPRMYVEALSPKIFVPQHHDNWAPGVSTRGENYEPVIRAELAKIPEADRPVLRFISDPQDYVRPEVLTFDVTAPFWR